MCHRTQRQEKLQSARTTLLGSSGFHSSDVRLPRLTDLDQSPLALDALYTPHLELLDLDTSFPLKGRIAYLPKSTFVHANCPIMTLRWSRGEATDRAVILLVKEGRIELECAEPLLFRSPGVHFVPSGSAPVVVSVVEPRTELVFISVPNTCVQSSVPEYKEAVLTVTDPVSCTLLAPMYAFIAGTCALSVDDVSDASPLISASREVIRATLDLIMNTGRADSRSLYGEAMRMILAEYTDPSFGVNQLASALNVSTRTMQASFRAERATVSGALREVRAAAASELKRRNPRLTRAQLAQGAGFGSVDALDRAMRLLHPGMPS